MPQLYAPSARSIRLSLSRWEPNDLGDTFEHPIYGIVSQHLDGWHWQDGRGDKTAGPFDTSVQARCEAELYAGNDNCLHVCGGMSAYATCACGGRFCTMCMPSHKRFCVESD